MVGCSPYLFDDGGDHEENSDDGLLLPELLIGLRGGELGPGNVKCRLLFSGKV